MRFIWRGGGHDMQDQLHATAVFLWPCIGVDGLSRPAWIDDSKAALQQPT